MVQSATQLFSNPEFQEMLSGFVNQFNVLNGNTNFESLLRLGETVFFFDKKYLLILKKNFF